VEVRVHGDEYREPVANRPAGISRPSGSHETIPISIPSAGWEAGRGNVVLFVAKIQNSK
jgi:hypothetical protein